MTLEQILEINGVSNMEPTVRGNLVAVQFNQIYVEKLATLVANDITLVKEHAMPFIKKLSDDMKLRYKSMTKSKELEEPEVVYLDAPKHIRDLNDIDRYNEINAEFKYSDISNITVEWHDRYYTEIFMQKVLPHHALYVDYRNSISASQVKEVWDRYIGGKYNNSTIELPSIASGYADTSSRLNDLYILNILGKNLSRYGTLPINAGAATVLAMTITNVTIQGIANRLKIIEQMSESNSPIYKIMRSGMSRITTKSAVARYVAKGGDVDTLKHIPTDGDVDTSSDSLLANAEIYANAYKEKYDEARIKLEQSMQGRMMHEYVQSVNTILPNIDTKYMQYDENLVIKSVLDAVKGIEFYDVYDIKHTCTRIVLEVFFKHVNSQMVIDGITRYTDKGFNLTLATKYTIEDMLVAVIGDMYTVE